MYIYIYIYIYIYEWAAGLLGALELAVVEGLLRRGALMQCYSNHNTNDEHKHKHYI